jgi:glycosyltransferase involved in cell wall biosynthesis
MIAIPPVTVIIPVFGAEKYIKRCAESLFAQKLYDIEYIFVDDCCDDNSISILEETISHYPDKNISLLHHAINLGVSIARKTGIENAHGEYVTFCDSDDWVEKDMYEKMYDEAIRRKADIVSCGYIEHCADIIYRHVFPQEQDSKELIFNFKCFGGLYGSICNKLIRRRFLLNNNYSLGDGLKMWEDSCFILPLRLKSKCTVFMLDCYYHYNVNEGSITKKFSIEKVKHSMEAVHRLEFYFKEYGYELNSRDLISNLKIASKEVLLKYPTLDNTILFKETYPETKMSLWSYPNWNILLKIRAFLVVLLPNKYAYWLLKYMRK